MKYTKAKALCLCTAVFLLVYRSAAWYTSNLDHVPTFLFNFEERMPFIPWTILPYMTSGIFFSLVFFLCEDLLELKVLTKRMLFTTVVAGLCYIIFPLRFSFPKPEVESFIFRPFFKFLEMGDLPYNQAPSLHIAFAFIFWTVFTKMKFPLRFFVGSWLILVGFSTLTTYQHHFVDIISGFILAHFCFVIIPFKKEDLAYKNLRVANYYYLSAGIVGFVTMFLVHLYSSNWLIFIWLFILLVIMGYNYQQNRTHFLKNKNGKILFYNFIFYFPYWFVYWFFWKFLRKNRKPIQIHQQIFISSRLDAEESKNFVNDSETIVYDLSAELIENKILLKNSKYNFHPFLDVGSYDINELRFLVNKIANEYRQLNSNSKILIHCSMGYSRSALVGVLVLKNILYLPLDKAIEKVRESNKDAIFSKSLLNFIKQHKL